MVWTFSQDFSWLPDWDRNKDPETNRTSAECDPAERQTRCHDSAARKRENRPEPEPTQQNTKARLTFSRKPVKKFWWDVSKRLEVKTHNDQQLTSFC